jgi:hypothetical protein
MRRLVAVLLSVMLLAAMAGPVAAKGPSGKGAEHIPVGSYDFTITSDIGCAGFDVLVEDISGRITEITLGVDGQGNERGKTLYHVVTRYTNTVTGAAITRAFHSIGHYLVRPDGSLEVKALGDTLLWGPEPAEMGLADGIWLVEDGKLSLLYTADAIDITFHRGTTLDVCAALS